MGGQRGGEEELWEQTRDNVASSDCSGNREKGGFRCMEEGGEGRKERTRKKEGGMMHFAELTKVKDRQNLLHCYNEYQVCSLFPFKKTVRKTWEKEEPHNNEERREETKTV